MKGTQISKIKAFVDSNHENYKDKSKIISHQYIAVGSGHGEVRRVHVHS